VIDTIADEKLIKEVVNLITKYSKELLNKPQKYEGLHPIKQIKEMGLEKETKDLMRVLTSHLNKLADKVSQYPTISPIESEGMLKRLSEDIKKEVGPNTPPPTPSDQDFNGIMISIGEVFSEINKVDKSKLFEDVNNSLGNVQSKGK
jgi:NTP pyrophosphatase (non-canonical NTP hydrolase)